MKSAVLKKWTSRPGELAWPSPVLVTLCYALKCHIWSYSAAENSRNRKEGLSPNTGAGVLSFRTQKWSGGYVKTTPTGKRFVGPWLGSGSRCDNRKEVALFLYYIIPITHALRSCSTLCPGTRKRKKKENRKTRSVTGPAERHQCRPARPRSKIRRERPEDDYILPTSR